MVREHGCKRCRLYKRYLSGDAVAREIETGMIHINDQTANDEVHVPFGGEKGSGTGRFGGSFLWMS